MIVTKDPNDGRVLKGSIATPNAYERIEIMRTVRQVLLFVKLGMRLHESEMNVFGQFVLFCLRFWCRSLRMLFLQLRNPVIRS